MSVIGSHRWLTASLMAVVALSGCSPDRPKTIPLTGRVTINGKAPGEVGQLYFTPTKTADGYSSRPASGAFTTDGNYRVMSWTPDDGLVPGHYAVSVAPADPNKTAIPAKYQQNTTSGLEVDVPIDQRKIEYNIELRRE
jgi:hypothetical protein